MIRKINGLYFLIMLTYSIVDKIYGTSYMNILYNSGLGIGLISIVLSAEDFMTMIFEYPSGIIADKMGRKRTTAIGMFILAVGYLLFIISKNFWFFVLAAFFKSLGVSLFSGSPQSWYYEELKKIDELKVREKSIPLLRSFAGYGSSDDYCFFSVGGASWLPPWLVGLYALCLQVDPDLDSETFLKYTYDTGYSNGKSMQKIADPQKLIEYIKTI